MIVLQHPHDHELRRKNRLLALFGERISNETAEQEDAKTTTEMIL